MILKHPAKRTIKPKDIKTFAKRAEVLLSWTLTRPQSKMHKKWVNRTRKEKLEGGCG